MFPVAFAWGSSELRDLPSGTSLWCMPFEMLPGGTMANAQCVCHGMVCAVAEREPGWERAAEPRFQVNPDQKLQIYSCNGTAEVELEPFCEQIVQAFRSHMENRLTTT